MSEDKILTRNKITVNKSGGLHARMEAAKLLKDQVPQASQALGGNRLALLLDYSGSMEDIDGRADGKSRSDLLDIAVQDFIQRFNPSTTLISLRSFPPQLDFPLTRDKATLILAVQQPKESGGTPMFEALELTLNEPVTRIILISDGDATDHRSEKEELVFRYKSLGIAIDTVHIGPSESGEALLKRLSLTTGGIYMKFTNVSNFAEMFHFLLPETRSMLQLPEGRKMLEGKVDEIIS